MRTCDATATAGLLWAACRPEPDTAAIAAAIADGADLAAAADNATAQRVSPLLVRGLRAAGVALESPWGDGLRDDAARCRAQAAMVLPRALRTAIEPLTSAGLEPLVIKGAAIAERYPAVGLRPMDDIDIVLPLDQQRRALDALTAAGWEVQPPWPGAHHEQVLTHQRATGLPLELHRALLTWREGTHGLTADELWERRQPQVMFGVSAFGLAVEDELVLLAAHAGKPFHTFDRLLWAVDVAVVVAAAADAGGVDWDNVAELARRSGCRTALAVSMAQAIRLGAAIPGHMAKPAATGSREVALAPVFDVAWPLTPRDHAMRHRLGYAVADQRRRQLALFVAEVTNSGLARVPAKVVEVGTRAARSWWHLRSGARTGTPPSVSGST